ncbi:dienelactone hydrolase family-domain-containing protein [Collybia nuda]|uniref:Dienelactone hydrolase family-domain-containing protein n=1 Tax=Collybia nuda TaxID=64659 RepID=A0A9P5XY93_9AGAR|nr:dienelactone hydrolase family-domain-containing protein [Collybia nuda]
MSTTSPALAGPPGDCCFTGVKHTGTPVGTATTIAGVPTYVSNAKGHAAGAQKKVIMFFADVFGPFHNNNKLIQDYFAEHGYTVLGCDYFFGDPVYIHTEKDFDRPAWMAEKKRLAADAVPKWIQAVRQSHGVDTKYCAVGYCFGGPFTLNLATTDTIVAAAFAHPAFLNEDHFTQIARPLFMSCAEVDHTFPLENRRRAEDLLISVKANYHIQVFSGVAHGFAVRGDPAIEQERWAKEESARGIIGWFDRFTSPREGKSAL